MSIDEPCILCPSASLVPGRPPYVLYRRGERTGQNELSTLRPQCGQRDASLREELVTLSVDKQDVGSSSR